MNEEVMNTETVEVSEVQEPVAEAQTETAEESPVVEERPVKKQQSRATNQEFAKFRRENERLQRELEAAKALTTRYANAVGVHGYQGTAEEVVLALEAANQGISPEEMARRNEAERTRLQEMVKQDPEYLAMKEKADKYEMENFQNKLRDDLAAINEAFPEAKVKNILDLGMDFAIMRDQGMDAVKAYAALQMAKKATEKPVPPVIGAVNTTPAEKEFYTSEEVDNIINNHPEMLDDMKIFERIKKSMTKWGKK